MKTQLDIMLKHFHFFGKVFFSLYEGILIGIYILFIDVFLCHNSDN